MMSNEAERRKVTGYRCTRKAPSRLGLGQGDGYSLLGSGGGAWPTPTPAQLHPQSCRERFLGSFKGWSDSVFASFKRQKLENKFKFTR